MQVSEAQSLFESESWNVTLMKLLDEAHLEI